MPISNKDRETMRRLADKQAAIAALPVQKLNIEGWTRMNRLERGKPMIWITEAPWPELESEEGLPLETEDEFCRGIEQQIRRTIYQWENFPGDMVVEPVFYCDVAFSRMNFGLKVQERTLEQGATDIVSHHYEPVIHGESDIEKIRAPAIVVDWRATEEEFQKLEKLFGDILPIRKRLRQPGWFAPWDQLVQWWGVEEALRDLVLRPELVHMGIERLISAHLAVLDQYERQGLLALNNGNVRIGSGGPGYTDQLPKPGFNPEKVRAVDCWGCATAQIFSEVSPQMHWEFAIKHELRWLERFGLTYYGCCEPLHRKMEIVKRIPNLRRVSMSPKADIAMGAEALGDKYVFSLKPNPAIVATDDWRVAPARAALIDAMEKTRGCVVEVVLKDLSTVRGDPRRLREWAAMAAEVTEEYS